MEFNKKGEDVKVEGKGRGTTESMTTEEDEAVRQQIASQQAQSTETVAVVQYGGP